MISFYLLWTLCYLVLLSWFGSKWPGVSAKTKSVTPLPSVTLLIALRNELENLDRLVSEIQKIAYPKLQILLVDDQSEDGTFCFLKENLSCDLRVKILQSPGIGKKSALEFGVENAAAELILCTDADCGFPADWVKNMAAPFSDPTVQMVCGPVMTTKRETFFQRFQQIEWASILLLTQYFFSKKHQLMCSGANLAYRRSAFLELKSYRDNKQHLSGDDEFLLKKVTAHFGGASCVYLPFSENLVITQPQKNFSDLINQRVRWAGKWKMHRDLIHAFSAVVSVVLALVWLGSLTLLGFGLPGVLAFMVVWIGKIQAEKIALGKVLTDLGFRHFYYDFLKTSLLHPCYTLVVAAGALRGKFAWKGRQN